MPKILTLLTTVFLNRLIPIRQITKCRLKILFRNESPVLNDIIEYVVEYYITFMIARMVLGLIENIEIIVYTHLEYVLFSSS